MSVFPLPPPKRTVRPADQTPLRARRSGKQHSIMARFDCKRPFARGGPARQVQLRRRPNAQCASVAHPNVASLRRKPFKPQGLATVSQQCNQSSRDIPVYRVDYVSCHGHQLGREKGSRVSPITPSAFMVFRIVSKLAERVRSVLTYR